MSEYLLLGDLAFVTSEDRKFYEHKGVDFKALTRAFVALIKNNGEVTQGGSNIPSPEAGDYVVRLHTNRTPFVIEYVKQ